MKRKNNNSIAAQARKAGIEPSVVYARLNQGWKLKPALDTPVQPRTARKETPPTHTSDVDPYLAKHAPKKKHNERITFIPLPVEHHRKQSDLVRLGIPALVIIIAIIIFIQ